jgi:hypothetical protein
MRFSTHIAARHWLDQQGGDLEYDSADDFEIVVAVVYVHGERISREFNFEKGLRGAAREVALKEAEKGAIEALADALAGED